MNVAELIEELQKLDPDLLVIYKGCMSGDIESAAVRRVARHENGEVQGIVRDREDYWGGEFKHIDVALLSDELQEEEND